MTYFLVEHPSRGVFVEQYWNGGKKKYRFSWSGVPYYERAHKFYTEREAREIADAVRGAVVMRIRRRGKKLQIERC